MDGLDAMPVFVLGDAVLMPGEVMALHVFEPRYRALLAWSLANHRHFAVGTLARAGGDVATGPALEDLVGVGRIVQHQVMPDGRANLLLMEVATAEVLDEVSDPEEPFRRLRLRSLAARAEQPPEVDDGLRALGAMAVGALGLPIEPGTLDDLRGRAWLDAMARLFLRSADARLGYLRDPDEASRCARVEGALADVLAHAGGADTFDA